MKNKTIKILSTSSDKGKRIDIFLSEKLKEMTRSNVKKMINQKFSEKQILVSKTFFEYTLIFWVIYYVLF